MNRRIAAIAVAGAMALGIGAVGVNAATASNSTMQPVKSAVPPVVSSTGTTSGMASLTANQKAPTVNAAMRHTTTPGGHKTAQMLPAGTSSSATTRAMQKAGSVHMKAQASRANTRAQLHSRNNMPARSGNRVIGG